MEDDVFGECPLDFVLRGACRGAGCPLVIDTLSSSILFVLYILGRTVYTFRLISAGAM